MHQPLVHDASPPFAHVGGTGAMLRLTLVNLLLNLLTLSLWRFWGKTRVRRLLWQGTVAWGDPAEYTGRGGELLLGFVVVVVAVLMPLMLALGAAQTAAESGSAWGELMVLAIEGVAVYLAFSGLYRARRYQLSRTVWRGIRAGQDGAAWRYGLMAVAGALACVVSLGWAWPWMDMMLARYRLNHTRLGDERFACDAAARPLYGRFALLWLCCVLFLAVLPVAAVVLLGGLDGVADMAASMLFAIGLALAAVAAVGLALPYAWYRAAQLRHLAATTRFAGTGFRLNAGAGRLLRLGLGNWLISVLSLGVLRPWAALRQFRFVCATLEVESEPDWHRVRQSAAAGPRLGEGLAAVFDGAGEF